MYFFTVFPRNLSDFQSRLGAHSPASLSHVAPRGGKSRRVTLAHPTMDVGVGAGLFPRLDSGPPCVCIFMEEPVVCQLHCHLSPDNLLTSRILECQPGCLYNCCLCQSLCEKCHRENEVRKQSCCLFFTKVTTTESITCFQDSFENISSF